MQGVIPRAKGNLVQASIVPNRACHACGGLGICRVARCTGRQRGMKRPGLEQYSVDKIWAKWRMKMRCSFAPHHPSLSPHPHLWRLSERYSHVESICSDDDRLSRHWGQPALLLVRPRHLSVCYNTHLVAGWLPVLAGEACCRSTDEIHVIHADVGSFGWDSGLIGGIVSPQCPRYRPLPDSFFSSLAQLSNMRLDYRTIHRRGQTSLVGSSPFSKPVASS